MLLECWKIQDSQGREKHAVTCRSQPIPTHGDQLLNLCESCKSVVSLKVKVKVTQWCPTLCDPLNYAVRGILQARILEWVAFPFSKGSSQPRSPTSRADSLTAEPQGKPKTTGVGSLPLLQGIFLTQGLKRGVLHCRQILYQWSYHGSPC